MLRVYFKVVRELTKLPHIPSQLTYSRLSEISPSRYTSIAKGCSYSFLMQQALLSLGAPSRLMPPLSYKNYIGTIIHKVFELVNKGVLTPSRSELKEFWKSEIACQEQRIATDFPTLTNLSIADYNAMFETIRVAERMRPFTSSESGASATIIHPNEHKVKISGLLKGSIDRVDALSDGSYRIVDYKTGKVFEEDGSIKEDYVSQLNLYAYLLEEQDKVRVSKLTIIDRNGTDIPVPYFPELKSEAFKKVKALLDTLNATIETGQVDSLCAPSEDNCRFCAVAHLCNKRHMTPESPYKIIEGTVTRVWNNDQLGITTSDYSVTVAKLRPLEIEEDEWASLLGKEVVFVNLYQVIENELYNRTDNTVIYIKDRL